MVTDVRPQRKPKAWLGLLSRIIIYSGNTLPNRYQGLNSSSVYPLLLRSYSGNSRSSSGEAAGKQRRNLKQEQNGEGGAPNQM
ncbi:MAG: hypothetical protein WEB89_07515 [Balneolales bacterium]